jgi:hypothetical protein
MLIRLNAVMRNFKGRNDYPMLFVVDRMGSRRDVVVLIVDILYEDRERAEGVAKEILSLLGTYNIKVVGYRLDTIMVPFKEVWRFVALVAVDHA